MLLRANVLLRPPAASVPSWWTRSSRMLNAGVIPWVPEQGSVGASGDLAPLSHIALALMGEGRVLDGTARRAGRRRRSRRARARALPIRAQGRSRVHQRHPGADRAARAAGPRRAGALAHRHRCGGDESRSASGNPGSARPEDPRGPAPPRSDRGGRSDARPAGARARSGSRTARTIPGCRTPTAFAAPLRCSAR